MHCGSTFDVEIDKGDGLCAGRQSGLRPLGYLRSKQGQGGQKKTEKGQMEFKDPQQNSYLDVSSLVGSGS